MTLPGFAPMGCAHGRIVGERCPWCEAVEPPFQYHSEASVEAAHAIKPTASRLREQVFEAIRDRGPLSDEQLAAVTGMNPNTCRPRRTELVKAGRIEKAGYTLTQAGRKSAAWQVVPGK